MPQNNTDPFQDKIDGLLSEIADKEQIVLDLNQHLADAQEDFDNALADLVAAEDFYTQGASPIEVTYYLHPEWGGGMASAAFPHDVNIDKNSSGIPIGTSIQGLPNALFRDYPIDVSNFDNLSSNLGVSFTESTRSQMDLKEQELFGAWQSYLAAFESYANAEAVLSSANQNVPGQIQSTTNIINQLQTQVDLLNDSYSGFLNSGLTPNEAGEASLAKLNESIAQEIIKTWGLRIGVAVAAVVALALLYQFLKKRGIIFKK